ncbi:MAG: ribosome silencing factor [Acidobacteria bacterium]|nr:ribosome silencing factor [Acidobacteriota bacterium]
MAAAAAMDKKAEDPALLDLRPLSSFTDYFLIVTGRSQRQTQAIASFVEEQLKLDRKRRALSIEGYQRGDWILMDYGDFVVHVFTPPTREYYDLERVWGDARRFTL